MTLLHILRLPDTPTEEEEKQLATLDKHQMRYLSRRGCWGCEWPLDRKGCGTYGGMPPCSEEARIERRRRCLEEYRPRVSRRGKRGAGRG